MQAALQTGSRSGKLPARNVLQGFLKSVMRGAASSKSAMVQRIAR